MGSSRPRRCSRASCAGVASRIKKHLMAAECARAAVRNERRVWQAQRQPRMRQEPHRLIFLEDRKSTRLNSSHANISYAVFCLKKKKQSTHHAQFHNDHSLFSRII